MALIWIRPVVILMSLLWNVTSLPNVSHICIHTTVFDCKCSLFTVDYLQLIRIALPPHSVRLTTFVIIIPWFLFQLVETKTSHWRNAILTFSIVQQNGLITVKCTQNCQVVIGFTVIKWREIIQKFFFRWMNFCLRCVERPMGVSLLNPNVISHCLLPKRIAQ